MSVSESRRMARERDIDARRNAPDAPALGAEITYREPVLGIELRVVVLSLDLVNR